MKKCLFVLVLALCLAVFNGCSGSDDTSPNSNSDRSSSPNPNPVSSSTQPAESDSNDDEQVAAEDPFTSDPITLTLFSNSAGINTDYDLEKLFIEPVKKMYPNISIEQIKGIPLDQLIVADEIPDIIATTYGRINGLIDLGLTSDLNPVVEKFNIDLAKMEKAVVEAVKLYSDSGEFIAMPYAMNYGVTVYNQDIFDLFGISYPSEHLTWPEVYELARVLTRKDGDFQYIGFNSSVQEYYLPLGLPVVDENDKPLLTSQPFVDIFQMVRTLYNIPGIVEEGGRHLYGGIKSFVPQQKVVMYPFWIAGLTSRVQAIEGTPDDFNWDLRNYPSYPDHSDVGREVEFQSIVVPPTGKNLEAVYRVIEAVVDIDAQKEINRSHSITVYDIPELRSESFSGLTVYDGKNLSSIFNVKSAPRILPTPYDDEAKSLLNDAVARMVVDQIDPVSALREANEKLEQFIKEYKGSNH